MNVVYMGTPEFAVPPLQAIINANHTVTGVFTQPDKPKGRGYVLTPPPVKECALENNIPVFQPKSMKDGEALEILKKLNPDVIVVVAFGKILPKEILDLPKYGCINVHASLLPKYRGAGPIQWCVLDGEEETGVTTMLMAEGLDTGDMLLKSSTKIGENETAGELHDRLSTMGADLIVETLSKLPNNEITPEKQDDNLSNYAPMLTKELCKIDWSKSAPQIHNQVRGLNPWPVAVATVNGKRVKIYSTQLSDKNDTAGKIICLNPLTVACGEGSVIITELQPEGKKRMNSQDYVRGYRVTTDTIFE
ncbi:MAG: methionyl-tRNA formyltransferase [Acutalibacteraceae bacterium]|nr:methionyl-tRNA formyltransferase [Acutalibacteraceae bacterium]